MSRTKRLTMLLTLLVVCGVGSCLVWHFEVLDWWMLRGLPPGEVDAAPLKWTWRVETVVEGLESPWAVAPLPDGRLLITERPGRLRVVTEDKLEAEPVPGVPEVSYRGKAGQGGLLDIALHPDFVENARLYLAYTASTEKGEMTQVASFRFTPEGLTDAKVVFGGVPGGKKSKHFGCRLAFGRDGKLYITLGERGEPKRAQDLTDLNGKTLRLNDDGTVPDDNPFVGRKDARPEIFSCGHRNAQGLAVQPETGLLWQTEHGPSWRDAPGGGDEINIVEAGRNYGWPVIHHRQTREDMVSPLVEYTPAIAPAGCTFASGKAFRDWQGDFFFTTLMGRSLVRLSVSGRHVYKEEVLIQDDFGRLRDVAEDPDGFLYVITSDTDAYGPGRQGGDRLLRIVPTPVDRKKKMKAPEPVKAKPPSVHDFTVTDIDDNRIALSAYRGKTLLIVNVASRCGFTPQYAGLQKLYETHKDKGLVVLGFPANNFLKQEPGTDAEIKTFCTTRYKVTFPMFSKISVKGDDIHPLYAFLTGRDTNPDFAGQITWNFNKFLVDRDGKIVARFGSKVTPGSKAIVEAIEKALAPEVPDKPAEEEEPAEAVETPDTKAPAPEEPAARKPEKE